MTIERRQLLAGTLRQNQSTRFLRVADSTGGRRLPTMSDVLTIEMAELNGSALAPPGRNEAEAIRGQTSRD